MKLCIFVASFELCGSFVIHFCSVVMYFVVMITCYFGQLQMAVYDDHSG